MRHRKSNRIIEQMVTVLLAINLVFAAIPVAHAVETSGKCGEGVQWSLAAGVLTISGKGAMTDYDEFAPAPWYAYVDSVQSVLVESGVTSVGEFAFFRMTKLTAVTLADSVSSIGGWAFYDCTALELLDLGDGVRIIEESAFEQCRALMSVRLPNQLEYIGDQAFFRCKSLKSITVPASVTHMGTEVFTYCSSLVSATVLANVKTLPGWTFYGCSDLSAVTMGSNIVAADDRAFEKCDNLPGNFHVANLPQDIDVDISTKKEENGQAVSSNNHFTQQGGSTVNVQTIKTQVNGDTDTKVEVDAVLENNESWDHLETQLKGAQYAAGGQEVDVTVNLKGDTQISGEDLGLIAGKNAHITIHTQEGVRWHIYGKDISAEDLQKNYQLRFQVRPLINPTKEQQSAVANADAFILVFDTDIDFKVEVEVPIGTEYARETAAFFAPGDNDYDRMQAVVIDGNGFAHFYLAEVQSDVEYLIGINVPSEKGEETVSDAIIPAALIEEYPNLEQLEQIEYVVTGRKSSWGINLGQLTWILAGVMVGSFVVVGAVMFVIFRRRLKRGYVPDMRYEDEIDE